MLFLVGGVPSFERLMLFFGPPSLAPFVERMLLDVDALGLAGAALACFLTVTEGLGAVDDRRLIVPAV